MNRLFILISAAALLLGSCTALTPEQKAAKEAEKQLELRHDSLRHDAAVAALEGMNFVLEADRLVFKRGRPAYVSSTTNFISSVNGVTTVQVAPFNGGGPNGVGGITVEGRASNIKKSVDKNGTFNMSMSVIGNGISASVNISVTGGTNRASAIVSPNFNSNRITLEGQLLPAADSGVYKGRSI